MASHVRRFSRFGADAPHHFGALRPGPRRPVPAHRAPWTVRGRWTLQERGSIGSQYHCSKIGKPPGHQAQTSQVLWPRAPERSCQEPPSICELPAPLASCPRDPGCAAPFSSRIPTGARTDSGEERKNDSAHVEQKNGAIVRHLIGYDRFASKAAYAQLTRVHEL